MSYSMSADKVSGGVEEGTLVGGCWHNITIASMYVLLYIYTGAMCTLFAFV